ncbi:hypothetical protein NDU88_001079 [Pleurodeles waltl]|uniref:Uncharacterized protein n=1 Tax=Pleurodeles waltl TaxID=8319 RepID=A0AAV7MJK2_PLEWA|nr:hypothetical protein NDU88_001079 [Pleurodeles waltl]
MVCASVSPLHTRTCVVIIHAGKTCSISGVRTGLLCGSWGFQMPRGLCVESWACRPAACRSGGLCVEFSSSRQASLRFPLWKSGGVVQAGCALKFRSHRRRRVNLFLAGSSSVFPDRRAVNFSPQSKLCVEFFCAQGVQLKDGSLFGPETSGNRKQALSKPLESTSAARQELSKAAGQQQGSSPL